MRVLDSIGVKYEIYPRFPIALVIGAAAVAVAAVAVMAVVLARKKRVMPKKEPAVPASGAVPGISGRHCVVTLSAGQVMLTDLGSSYGTFLAGGRKLTPDQPVPLRVGDRFYLRSAELLAVDASTDGVIAGSRIHALSRQQNF